MISNNKFGKYELDLIKKFKSWEVPYIVVHNKSDLAPLKESGKLVIKELTNTEIFEFSTLFPGNLDKIIESLKQTIPESVFQKPSLLGGLVNKNDYVLLITPIDAEAPDGRMILPQVMAIRDVLDNDCINIVLKEDQISNFLKTSGIKPKLAVTDSQIFSLVKDLLPTDIPLTSFSILFARMRGNFENYKNGTRNLGNLKDGDRVLILESCSHQVNCDDIGRFKIPSWLKEHTGKKLDFDVVSGLNKVEREISDYAQVIQCGGCMVTRKQLKNRLKPSVDANIPVTNYGLAIAWINEIYDRAIAPFEAIDV